MFEWDHSGHCVQERDCRGPRGKQRGKSGGCYCRHLGTAWLKLQLEQVRWGVLQRFRVHLGGRGCWTAAELARDAVKSGRVSLRRCHFRGDMKDEKEAAQ